MPGLGEGGGPLCTMGAEFQFCKVKRDLEIDGGNDYTESQCT